MLVILQMMDISRLSHDSKCSDEKAEDVCRKFGKGKAVTEDGEGIM